MSTTAQAAPVGLGESKILAAEADPSGASLLATTGWNAFTADTFVGSILSNVYTNDSSNPFGLDALTFTYQLKNTNTLPEQHDIERLTIGDYAGFATDISHVAGTGDTTPFVKRSSDGDVIGFNFTFEALADGKTSTLLVVQTDAKTFGSTHASVIDGSVVSVLSVAPGGVNAVPFPAAVWGGFALLGGLGLTRHFRRRKEASLEIA